MDQPVLLERGVFREHAVAVAAQSAALHRIADIPAQPGLVEDPSHAVAHLHARHVRTDLDDLTGTIGEGDHLRTDPAGPVLADGDGQVAKVERGCVHPHEHLPTGRLRHLFFHEGERFDSFELGQSVESHDQKASSNESFSLDMSSTKRCFTSLRSMRS